MKLKGVENTVFFNEMKITSDDIKFYIKTISNPDYHWLEQPRDNPVWVEDADGNELFRTCEGANVAIQWAIDHIDVEEGEEP